MSIQTLSSHFGATVGYYIYASFALPVGAELGKVLARDPLEPWHGRLVVAHVALNLGPPAGALTDC
jgi:nitrite reductase (NO-forming)